jgi:hypothetical protein
MVKVECASLELAGRGRQPSPWSTYVITGGQFA